MNQNFEVVAVLSPTNDHRHATPGERRPVEALTDAVTAGGSGEFIFAANKVEVHVFLQRGRLAWATDSSHPFEFARYLKERCSIDDEAFREVLDECRRSRSPLGQTLVEWELATWDDVRSSLRRQLRLALGTLATSPRGPTMFLTRDKFEEYDDKLTFELGDLLAELDSNPVSSRALPTAPGANAQQVLEAIRGAAWVVLGDSTSVETATVGPEPVVPMVVADRTLGDGADFFALRSADDCLIGAHLVATPSSSSSRSLWCMLTGDSTFRGAVAAVASLGLVTQSRHERRIAPEPIAWRHGILDASWSAEVEQVFAYGAEVFAVALLSASGELVAGIGRASLDMRTCAALARRRASVFGAQPPSERGELEALGFRYRTMVTGETEVWAFGAEIPEGGEAATLWVMVGRQASQGVGWACLTALLRRCHSAPEART